MAETDEHADDALLTALEQVERGSPRHQRLQAELARRAASEDDLVRAQSLALGVIRGDDALAKAEAFLVLEVVGRRMHDPEAANEALRQAEANAAEAGATKLQVQAMLALAYNQRDASRLDEAEALADAPGMESLQLQVRLNRLIIEDPEPALAVRQWQEVVESATRTESERWLLHGVTGLAEAKLPLGEIEAAVSTARRAVELAQGRRESPLVRQVLARTLMAAGSFDEADSWLEGATEDAAPELRARFELLRLPCDAALRGPDAVRHRFSAHIGGLDPHNQRTDTVAWSLRRTVEQVHAEDPQLAVELLAALERLGALPQDLVDELAEAEVRIPFGRGHLAGPIGSGGYAEVWRADLPEGSVAVKFLTSVDAARIDELEREAGIVASLEHAHVVPILDTGTVGALVAGLSAGRLAPGTPWLSMPLADGSLRNHRGELAWPEIRRILLGLADALATAHADGLLHLDVKPENVLVADGSFWLADFGLAAHAGERSDRLVGTPRYMAPERFVAGTALDARADLYALGCLAWELVTGQPPFVGDVSALRRAHRRAPIPPLQASTAVPSGLEDWLRVLLAKQPASRFSSAAEAARALAALDSTDSSAPSSGFGHDAAETFDFGMEDPIAQAQSPGVPEDWLDVLARDVTPHRQAVLLEVRRTPLHGLAAQQDALWALLLEALQSGFLTVRLRGEADRCEGLRRWLRRTARRAGFDPPPIGFSTGDEACDRELKLPETTDEDVFHTIRRFLDLHPADAAELAYRSNGDVDHAIAVVRYWGRTGGLVPGEAGWRRHPSAKWFDPAQHAAAVRRVLALGLSVDEQAACSLLAQGGRRVAPGSWARVLERSGNTIRPTADLVRAGLLRPCADGRLRFADPALRHHFASWRTPKQGHELWAQVTEGAVRGLHLAHLEDPEALGLLIDAGWRAFETGGLVQAQALVDRYHRTALTTGRTEHSGEVLRAWVGLVTGARPSAEHTRELLRRTEETDEELRVHAALLDASCAVTERAPDVQDRLRALTELPGHAALGAMLQAEAAQLLAATGHGERARALARRAVATPLDPQDDVQAARACRAWRAAALQLPDDAPRLWRLVLEHGLTANHRATAHTGLGWDALPDDPQRAARHFRQALHLDGTLPRAWLGLAESGLHQSDGTYADASLVDRVAKTGRRLDALRLHASILALATHARPLAPDLLGLPVQEAHVAALEAVIRYRTERGEDVGYLRRLVGGWGDGSSGPLPGL